MYQFGGYSLSERCGRLLFYSVFACKPEQGLETFFLRSSHFWLLGLKKSWFSLSYLAQILFNYLLIEGLESDFHAFWYSAQIHGLLSFPLSVSDCLITRLHWSRFNGTRLLEWSGNLVSRIRFVQTTTPDQVRDGRKLDGRSLLSRLPQCGTWNMWRDFFWELSFWL